MRRQELKTEDPALLDQVLANGTWGTLCLKTDEEWPYSVPVNYLWWQGAIWIHGASMGKRFNLAHRHPQSQFTVVQEHTLIPSYALGEDLACPATQFFQSVMLWGNAHYLNDLERKAQVLQAFMLKYQSEGQHTPIDATNPRYQAALQNTAVLEIRPQHRTGKFKFGQNLSSERALQLIDFLKKRNSPGDNESALWMQNLRKS